MKGKSGTYTTQGVGLGGGVPLLPHGMKREHLRTWPVAFSEFRVEVSDGFAVEVSDGFAVEVSDGFAVGVSEGRTSRVDELQVFSYDVHVKACDEGKGGGGSLA